MELAPSLKQTAGPSHPVVKRSTIFIGIGATAVLLLVIASFTVYHAAFSAPQSSGEIEEFITPLQATNEEIIAKLEKDGFIKRQWAFEFALKRKKGNTDIVPGGYMISKSMRAWDMAALFSEPPTLVWITIPEGLRKEEIGEILEAKLGWHTGELEKWNTVYTTTKYEYTEGVYFPDTYLIPRDETPADTAARLQRNFEEKFAPFAQEALKQNIRWYTVIRLASIIQREAAGKSDMPLISGILWNRLLINMKLEVDPTVRYARGKTAGDWWDSPIKPEDKTIDSPFNTYKYKGLPPHPISNPGVDAIKAVLFPEKTEFLFYLHDPSGQIHTGKTYEEHKQNIETYLK